MNAKEFVDSLFEGYENTAALADFKEELLANMNAKIESFVRKGMSNEEAFAKASAELGDVSAFADELSLKKRKEVFEEVYMDIRQYMPPKRVAGYVTFSIIALFGIVIALTSFFTTNYVFESIGLIFGGPIVRTSFFGSLMPFLTAAVVGFTYLGITQETSTLNPISRKRGALYAVATGLICFGILTMPVIYFGLRIADEFTGNIFKNTKILISIFSVVVPFILPGIGMLIYLLLTEKSRFKPWAKKQFSDLENELMDPASAARFGLISGGIWLLGIAAFVLVGILVSFKYSWPIILFATAIQLIVQALMYKRKAK